MNNVFYKNKKYGVNLVDMASNSICYHKVENKKNLHISIKFTIALKSSSSGRKTNAKG